MSVLDHIVVSAATVEEGAAHITACLGVSPGPGGQHAAMGTHNRLVGLDAGEYLEAIAIDPAGRSPDQPRWFGLDRRSGLPRLSNWVIRTDDLDGLVARHSGFGRIHSLSRGGLRWRMAVPGNGELPFGGFHPAALEWQGEKPAFPDAGLRLKALELHHPEGETLAATLNQIIDDDRISVQVGPLRLRAVIETPDGPRDLA